MAQTYIKVFLDKDVFDNTHDKDYSLIVVNQDARIDFNNFPYPIMTINGKEQPITGKVYVMSEYGHTISTFTPRTLTEKETEDMLEYLKSGLGLAIGKIATKNNLLHAVTKQEESNISITG